MRLWQAGLMGAAILALAVGCSSDGPTEPEPASSTTLMVNADQEWAYVHLGEAPTIVTVGDTLTSTGWDIAFLMTSVKLNGGAGGPGDVTAICLCQNAGATDDEVQQFSADTELADFEAVDADDIPASASAWTAASESRGGPFDSEDGKWYRYDLTGNHLIWPTFNVYLVKRADTVFKVQLISYYGPAGEPRQISFRSARISP